MARPHRDYELLLRREIERLDARITIWQEKRAQLVQAYEAVTGRAVPGGAPTEPFHESGR